VNRLPRVWSPDWPVKGVGKSLEELAAAARGPQKVGAASVQDSLGRAVEEDAEAVSRSSAEEKTLAAPTFPFDDDDIAGTHDGPIGDFVQAARMPARGR